MQSADLPLNTAITPNLDQFQALAAAPDEGPVVMLNLLEMVSSPEYLEAHADRGAGLERTVVLAVARRP